MNSLVIISYILFGIGFSFYVVESNITKNKVVNSLVVFATFCTTSVAWPLVLGLYVGKAFAKR